MLTVGDTPVSPSARGTIAERATLVIYDGTSDGNRVVDLPDGATITVGRGASATVVIDSDNVSRVHAQFLRRGNLVWVEDLGSRNGTHVNGESIATCTLTSGDQVIVGPATIAVTIVSRVENRPRVEGVRALEERLAAEIDRGRYKRTFALVMLRLEGEVSDIEAAVDRVAALLHPMETLAEYSGVEFAVLMPELDRDTGRDAAARLLAAARGPGITASAGVAAFPDHGTGVATLIARAVAAVGAVRDGTVGAPPEDPVPLPAEVLVKDPQMVQVYDLAHKVAGHSITVLIHGETGVGKEMVAAAIHHAGTRASGPLVRLNCASLPETLLESELFGHEKGAFTGADRRKLGYFEAARGGTLFLDEIGELSPATQAKLLRVLETRRITRVGGTEEIEIDVRVVCATNRDLMMAVTEGAFRSDLFFRISAFTIVIPPLRDRPGEIPMLAEHFVELACEGRKHKPRLSPAVTDALRCYAWPGNVRELRNAIERAVVLHTRGVLELEDLPERIRDVRIDPEVAPESWQRVVDTVADVERTAIATALDACNGNQTETAKRLGITRRTLIYRMEKYGFKPAPGRKSTPPPKE